MRTSLSMVSVVGRGGFISAQARVQLADAGGKHWQQRLRDLRVAFHLSAEVPASEYQAFGRLHRADVRRARRVVDERHLPERFSLAHFAEKLLRAPFLRREAGPHATRK